MVTSLLALVCGGFADDARAESGWGWNVNEIPVVTGPGDQKSPVSSGDTVYYVDTYAHSIAWMMKKNLFEGSPEEVIGPGLSTGPDAEGGTVAWHRESKVCRRLPGGEPDQCLSTTTSLNHLAYSGNNAISEGGTSVIRVYDFEARSSRMIDQSTMSGMRYDPDIDGNQAVYVKMRGYAGKYYEPLIVMYDVDKDIPIYMTEPGGGTVPSGASRYARRNPAISGETIVYQERDIALKQDWDIKLASLGTQGISFVGAPGDQINPAISGNLVVYQDNRTGHWNEAGQWVGEWNIYMKDMSTGIEQPVCTAPGDQANPRIRDNVIVWEDNRSGDGDVYGAVLSTAAGDAGLLDDYAPRLVLHPDEDFRPMDVTGMVSGPGTTLFADGQERLRAPGGLSLDAIGAFGAGSYIDLPGACVICGPHPVDAAFDRYVYTQYVRPYDLLTSSGTRDVMYGRVVHRGDRTVLQYWLDYYFNNHPLISHEGDWELIEVELGSDGKPSRVSASQHDYGRMRYWRDVEEMDGHPVLYVGRGSHANYFEPGPYTIRVEDVPAPVAVDETGTRENGTLLAPPVTQLPGNSFDESGDKWLGFAGHWGELNGNPNGDSPLGPAWSGSRWDTPFGWDGLGWDGFSGIKGALIGLGIQVGSPVNVAVSHIPVPGAGLAGEAGEAQPVEGVRCLEVPELGRKAILAPFAAGGSYRLQISAGESVKTPVYLTLADPVTGQLTELSFGDIDMIAGAVATVDLASGTDAAASIMTIDGDGDGVAEDTRHPNQVVQTSIDLSPPAAVSDLAAARVTRSKARLTWTAPGDDGVDGNASAYAVRYSTEPVTDSSWPAAVPAEVTAAPLPAGVGESLEVEGLPEGKVYFAVKARDGSGNESGLSAPAMYTVEPPELVLHLETAYWPSYSDFLARELAVRYVVENSGRGEAGDVTISRVETQPEEVGVAGSGPEPLDWLAPGETFPFEIRFRVPAGNGNFLTTLSARCLDMGGREIRYGPGM